MQHKDQQADGFGQRLPGTGGDVAPEDLDTEGHRRVNQAFPGADADVVGPERARRMQNTPGDADDVEGHLYTSGPSTRGEFIRRGPGDAPHGD